MLSLMVCLAVLRGPVLDTGAPVMMPAARLLAILEARKPCEVIVMGAPALEAMPVRFHPSPENCTPEMLVMVLKAHGIRVDFRRLNGRDWQALIFRSPAALAQAEKKTLPNVHVYVPRRMAGHKLMALLDGSTFADKVKGYSAPGGRIVLRADRPEDLQGVLDLFQRADNPRKQKHRYHVFQCVGMTVDRAHADVLRLMNRETLSRIRFVVHQDTNTLLAACGSDDWGLVLKNLKSINPKGREL